MANLQEAYDFSLFEEHNAAREIAPQPVEIPRREGNLVELPGTERRRQREQPATKPKTSPQAQQRPRRDPVRMAVAVVCFMAIFCVAILAVYSEVQLTELTDKINMTQKELQEAQSLEVQLTMQAAARMSDAQVEEYVSQQLGMGKVTGSQVIYMRVTQQDKGRVIQQIDGGSWLDGLLEDIRGLLAG